MSSATAKMPNTMASPPGESAPCKLQGSMHAVYQVTQANGGKPDVCCLQLQREIHSLLKGWSFCASASLTSCAAGGSRLPACWAHCSASSMLDPSTTWHSRHRDSHTCHQPVRAICQPPRSSAVRSTPSLSVNLCSLEASWVLPSQLLSYCTVLPHVLHSRN
jgi:hypothetical protein